MTRCPVCKVELTRARHVHTPAECRETFRKKATVKVRAKIPKNTKRDRRSHNS